MYVCVSEWVCVCVCVVTLKLLCTFLAGLDRKKFIFPLLFSLSLSLSFPLSLSLSLSFTMVYIICISFSKSYCFCSCAMWILQTTDTHNVTHPLCLNSQSLVKPILCKWVSASPFHSFSPQSIMVSPSFGLCRDNYRVWCTIGDQLLFKESVIQHSL